MRGATLLAKNVKDSEALMTSNFVESALIKTEKYKVVNRTNLKFVLAKQKLDVSDMVDIDYAFKLGTLLQVDFVIVGSLSKIIEVYSGKVVNAGTEKTDALFKLKKVCRNLVWQLLENRP